MCVGTENKFYVARMRVSLIRIVGGREILVSVLYSLAAIPHIVVAHDVVIVYPQLPRVSVVRQCHICVLPDMVPITYALRGCEEEPSFAVFLHCYLNNAAGTLRAVAGIRIWRSGYLLNLCRRQRAQKRSEGITLKHNPLAVYIDVRAAKRSKRNITFAVNANTWRML